MGSVSLQLGFGCLLAHLPGVWVKMRHRQAVPGHCYPDVIHNLDLMWVDRGFRLELRSWDIADNCGHDSQEHLGSRGICGFAVFSED